MQKTDRLYRNLKDWIMSDDLGVDIHLVKEGTNPFVHHPQVDREVHAWHLRPAYPW